MHVEPSNCDGSEMLNNCRIMDVLPGIPFCIFSTNMSAKAMSHLKHMVEVFTINAPAFMVHA